MTASAHSVAAGRAIACAFAACAAFSSTTALRAQDADVNDDRPIVLEALRASSEDVRVFDEHLVTLANPFLEGRIPGSRGMEIAKDYMQFYLERAGLEPAFPDPQAADGPRSWRQPFPLGRSYRVTEQVLSVPGAGAFTPNHDFGVTKYGGSGEIEGEVVFCGYGIESGPDGFTSFGDDDVDLTGKIALVFRFEPMDADGRSIWSQRVPWSRRAGMNMKLRAMSQRNAAAVVVVNPPNCADPRANDLKSSLGTRRVTKVPVLAMSPEAGQRLVARLDAEGRSLAELRAEADVGGKTIAFGKSVSLRATLKRDELIAENVGGLLPGRGALADELIVVGAHLDHLGTGSFGSRGGRGKIHPGADDNATGAAAVLMIADKVARDYANLPEGTPARSILFVGFSAEESGLNGSRHYVKEPIVERDKHALMINFDMIGRPTKRRFSISGGNTAKGMSDWLQPLFDATPVTVVQPSRVAPNSDHAAFFSARIPVLFAIIADLHADYHTPRDTSDLINRVDAVHMVHLFHEITRTAALRTEPFEFTLPGRKRDG